MARFMFGETRARWPETVPVTPGRPPARVAGDALRITWVGHATALIQTQGLNILTDPIWSNRTGPFALGPRRVRAPGVRFADLPKIDAVLISHNHYDHMDLPTLQRLWARDRPLIVTSLGNDTILRRHGIPAVARDWEGRVALAPGIAVIVKRVHHWDSRTGKDRNRALWSGFTITLPGGNIFFGGDTGYGDGTWVADAMKDGPYRFAILPIGAFEPRAMMRDSHIDPAEAVDVFVRLGARDALAIHWGTFQLSNEAIDAPPERLRAAMRERGLSPDRFRATEPGAGWDIPR
jgi:L-ascorbate metabolism protein UlaG (beta-lactamase superfamily)